MFTFKLDERSKDPYFSHEEKIFQHQTLTSNTRKYLKTVSLSVYDDVPVHVIRRECPHPLSQYSRMVVLLRYFLSYTLLEIQTPRYI